jgi:hypothetical protein
MMYTTTITHEVQHRFPIGARVAAQERVRVIEGIKYGYPIGFASYYGTFEDDGNYWSEPVDRADHFWHEVP